MQVTFASREDPDNIISLADVKRHLRVVHNLEDTLITSIRNAAIQWVENYANIRIGSVTAYGYLPRFVASYFPVGPVREINTVEYETDNDGTLATLSSSSFHKDIRTQPARIAFSDVPTVYEYALMPVRIEFSVGYDVAAIPEPVMAAIKLICGHLYENRQDEVIGTITSRLKLGVDALLAGERIMYIQ